MHRSMVVRRESVGSPRFYHFELARADKRIDDKEVYTWTHQDHVSSCDSLPWRFTTVVQLFYISVIPCLELQMSSFKYFGCCLTFKTLQHGVCCQGSCFCLHPELQFCLTDFLNIFMGAKTKPRRIQGVWEHFPLEIFFTIQGSEIASELRSVFNQNISTICVLSVISVALYSATKHGHHVDVVSAIAFSVTHSVRQSEQERQIRTTVKFMQR